MKKLIVLIGFIVFAFSLKAQTTIVDGMTGLEVRTILNDNFQRLFDTIPDTTAMLSTYINKADTAAMLENYIEASETFSTSSTTPGTVPGSNSVGAGYYIDATGNWTVPPSGGSGLIIVAADDATAEEKAAATYLCNGSNDETQWSLANTAAAGNDVRLTSGTFYIEDDITLTSHFYGIAAAASGYGTQIIMTDAKQILLHCPGNLTNMRILAYGRTSDIPVVQIEVINGTNSYDSKFNLLNGILLFNDNDDGVGLKIYCEGVVGSDFNYMSFNTFGTFTSAYFDTNVVIECRENTGATAFINSNTFEGIMTSNGVVHLSLTTSGSGDGAIGQNVFEFIHMQRGTNSTNGIILGDDSDIGWNHFLSVQAMDWTVGQTSYPAINLGENSYGNKFYGLIPQWNQDINADPWTPTQNNNRVQNYQDGNTEFPYNGILTIASGIISPTKGQGEYSIEGQGAASDVLVYISGNMSVGDRIRLKINTPGQVITISDYMQYIPTDYKLIDAKDYIVLRCVASGRFLVEKYYQHKGSDIKTANYIIGINGVADCDFNFASVANTTIQNLDLGSIVPAGSRIMAVEMICIVSLTGGTITLRAGNTSGGEQLIADASNSTANDVTGISDAAKLPAITMNWASATNIFIGGTPSANWNTLSTGKWSIFVTFIDYHGGWNY